MYPWKTYRFERWKRAPRARSLFHIFSCAPFWGHFGTSFARNPNTMREVCQNLWFDTASYIFPCAWCNWCRLNLCRHWLHKFGVQVFKFRKLNQRISASVQGWAFSLLLKRLSATSKHLRNLNELIALALHYLYHILLCFWCLLLFCSSLHRWNLECDFPLAFYLVS